MSFRVALFCSFHRGVAMLETMLSLQLQYPEITICGVATDDPTKPWASADKRIWQYDHTKQEEEMVEKMADDCGIPVWKNRVRTNDFIEIYTKQWMPDICYMGVFGQKIPEDVWSYPLYGFYNFHTCAGREWPSNVGGNPVKDMLARGEKKCAVAMHNVDNEWDNGDLVAFSEFFQINDGDDIIKIHKRSNPLATKMMAWHICETLGKPMKDYTPRVSKKYKQHLISSV